MSMVPDTEALAQIEGRVTRPLALMPEHWQAILVGGALLALVAYRRLFRELMPR